MKDLILNERWRPKKIDDMILLPRIKKIFEKGVQQNFIFYGHFGTGKTTLARILIGKWTKDKPFLEINSSLYTSIDILRTKIDDFCSNVYMGLDLLSDDIQQSSTKYVFLDEFERTSIQYQDALKAYIEEYSTKGVRFILNTNHLDKISDGIKSRMTLINFDAQSPEEEKFVKRGIYLKVMDDVSKKEGISITKDQLVKLINTTFPDIRSIYNKLQYYSISGDITENSIENEDSKLKLYELIHTNQPATDSNEYETVFNFVNENFGQDNIKVLLKFLGSDYSKWLLANHRIASNKLFEINNIVSVASWQLESVIDPIILAVSTIGKIKKLIYTP